MLCSSELSSRLYSSTAYPHQLCNVPFTSVIIIMQVILCLACTALAWLGKRLCHAVRFAVQKRTCAGAQPQHRPCRLPWHNNSPMHMACGARYRHKYMRIAHWQGCYVPASTANCATSPLATRNFTGQSICPCQPLRPPMCE